ncbi:MAG: restriction endonuclease [Candidatus Bathyarchaeota archaeon]|nr:restriction endonuclease [Candidatus Bathyarchaeota archaeon]
MEKENNRQGDLFGRLLSDLFLALGYDDIRLNIHKTGREVDIEAFHRTESRRVIAECKATKTRIGGDAVNKFVGVLDAEKRKFKETVGYFISLSGFNETAIEQEKEVGGSRVILLNGKQIIDELVKGKIIVSPEKAMERAGCCSKTCSKDFVPEENCELLAHELGWIWLIYYTRNKQRTSFALVHADGDPLATSLAEKIKDADKSIGGKLHSLEYLSPPSELINEGLIEEAKKKYFTYLSKECGEITLGGLPADQEVGSRRLSLEHLFVPLYLQTIESEKPRTSEDFEKYLKNPEERTPVGQILSKCPRLAILADPGGGKTTLLKRVAIAYAFPDRKDSVDDKLPDRKWLPLFIRCRQLSNLSKSSIFDILSTIPNLAEMNNMTKPFSLLISRSLQDGEALLLIDGLDEISDETERVTFTNQLRTFLSTYPAAGIIITSREAGFRIIGGALSACCKHYKIADFDDADIRRLTLAWHKEVIGAQKRVILDAEKLANNICQTQRVRTLARNPLLLTTLLLVKRWVGQLPSRRSILYGKAIEVLLMTWNVEGYKPIEQDEAVPQLAFIAFAMMKEGVQRISLKRLKELLILARTQMPDVLGYARISVSEFVKQVELRSSILIFSGHSIEQGTLYPMYEFRHLTFQEYLTARAIVDGYYPDREEGDTILSILEPHLDNSNWKEVIPLAAILAGRNAQPLIKRLIEKSKKTETKTTYGWSDEPNPVRLLVQCFLDEVQVAPDLLEEGLKWIVRNSFDPYLELTELITGKYQDVLFNVAQQGYLNFEKEGDLPNFGSIIGAISLDRIRYNELVTTEIVNKILDCLNSNDFSKKARGALMAMELAYNADRPLLKLKKIGDAIVPLLFSEDPRVHFAAAWVFAWLGEHNLWSPRKFPEILYRLFTLSNETNNHDVEYVTRWAFCMLPIIDRKLSPFLENDQKLIADIKRLYSLKDTFGHNKPRVVSLIAGFYTRAPWSDSELMELIVKRIRDVNEADFKNALSMKKQIETANTKRITDFCD